MTERVRNIVIAVALAATAALLTGLYVTNYQRHVRQNEEHSTVYVAARDIPAGTSGADAMQHKMLVTKVVSRSAVVPGSISNTTQLAGSIANQTIYTGEQITTSRFSDSAVAGIQGKLKGTMRAYQLQGDGNQLLAGTLRAGDHVDIVATFKYTTPANGGSGTTGFATRTVLRNIFILEPSGPGVAASKLTSGNAGNGSIILRLTDAQAQKLDLTINTAVRSGDYNPTWRLTLRSPLNAADSPDTVTTLSSVLLDGLSAQQRSRLEGKYQGGS
jgi:Flp pilus assembly protein CpaB